MVNVQNVTATNSGTVTTQTYQWKPPERSIFTPPPDPKILIVMPVINLWKEYTEPAINSIRSKKHSLMLLIIDNGSVDETKDEAQRMSEEHDWIIYQRNDENLGCSKSWNFGIRKGFWELGADYVMIVNNDILLHENTIDRLVERFQKGDEDLVMATALNIRGECNFPEEIFLKNDKEKEVVPESEAPDFSCFMVNRKLLEEVGEFDEGFSPAYFEDNDMHYRIKLAGLRAICYPPAIYYHYGSGTQNDARYPMGLVEGYKFERNRMYFVNKWGGPPGQEIFRTPFNDPSKTIKWTKQMKK